MPLPAAGVQVLKGYQQARLTCFIQSSKCSAAQGYNLDPVEDHRRRGPDPRGRPERLDRRSTPASFPRSNTDFAFASYAEQRGFVGAVILLALYLLVLWRGLRVVTVARDLYSAVVAGGIVLALFFQIFVNVGMTMGIAPITGIPLPFLSVGGSAMIANLAAMGVLLAIHARGKASRRGVSSQCSALARWDGGTPPRESAVSRGSVPRALLDISSRGGSFVARPVVRLRRRSGGAPSSGLRVSPASPSLTLRPLRFDDGAPGPRLLTPAQAAGGPVSPDRAEPLRQARPRPRLDLVVARLRLASRRLEILEPRVGLFDHQKLFCLTLCRHVAPPLVNGPDARSRTGRRRAEGATATLALRGIPCFPCRR